MAQEFIPISLKKPCQIDIFVCGMLFDPMIVEDGAKSILIGPQDGLKMVGVARHKQKLNFPLVFT